VSPLIPRIFRIPATLFGPEVTLFDPEQDPLPMSLAGSLMLFIGVLWIGGGTLWLLLRRRYQLYQIPQFAMDLIGFPVELAGRCALCAAAAQYADLWPVYLRADDPEFLRLDDGRVVHRAV
jgi:hypothetical protein